MTRDAIHASAAPAAIGPYSHAVRHGEVLYLSGQSPLDPQTGELVPGDVAAQARQVFANLATVLDAAGSTFDDVIKVNVFLADLADFSAVNAVYAEIFAEPYPARTTVAAGLPLGASVEIEVIASTR